MTKAPRSALVAAVDYHTAGEPFRIVTGGRYRRRLAIETHDGLWTPISRHPDGQSSSD